MDPIETNVPVTYDPHKHIGFSGFVMTYNEGHHTFPLDETKCGHQP